MHRKLFAGSVFLLAFSFVLASLSLTVPIRGYDIPRVYKTWKCSGSDGFEIDWDKNKYCFMQGCMSEYMLSVWSQPRPVKQDNLPSYDFKFTAPYTGEYQCAVTVTTNYFGYDSTSTPQLDEVVDVFLNDVKIGTTGDHWCLPDPGGIIGDNGGTHDDCTRSPTASSADKNECTTPGTDYWCDDDGIKVRDGKVLVLDLRDCASGTYAFVKDTGSRNWCPHCQYWTSYPKSIGKLSEPSNCEQGETNLCGDVSENMDIEIVWIHKCTGNDGIIKLDSSVCPKCTGELSVGAWGTEKTGVISYCEEGGTDPDPDPDPEKCDSDNVLDPGEQCDITKLDDKECTDVAGPDGKFEGGILGCQNDPNFSDQEHKVENICEFDTSKCYYLYNRCNWKYNECRTYISPEENYENTCTENWQCEL